MTRNHPPKNSNKPNKYGMGFQGFVIASKQYNPGGMFKSIA
jgi:hypothetical protein